MGSWEMTRSRMAPRLSLSFSFWVYACAYVATLGRRLMLDWDFHVFQNSRIVEAVVPDAYIPFWPK